MSELSGCCVKRKGGALVPADFHADDVVGAIPDGREVIISIRMPRNPRFHRWFFALLRKVVDNTDDMWRTEEHLLFSLKIAVGHCDVTNTLNGEAVVIPKSINFSKMTELAFKTFVIKCLHEIHVNLGIDPDQLMEEVNREEGPI